MAMTAEENELLTRVENGAPMGEMIRQHYWMPAVPSATLVADGAPVLVRLLGTNYVAFRTTDGRAGLIDELCPHRRTSMMMARNEDNGLRCIFHGWKTDVQGKVVEAPNQVGDQAQFCKRVKTGQYRVEERGGIVWVWLGKGDTPPRFPDLPFTICPPTSARSRAPKCQPIGCKVWKPRWILRTSACCTNRPRRSRRAAAMSVCT